MKRFKGLYCKVRKDLFDKRLSVPIWNNKYSKFICGLSPIKYRWLKDSFQVYIFRQWFNAYSIDFEFSFLQK